MSFLYSFIPLLHYTLEATNVLFSQLHLFESTDIHMRMESSILICMSVLSSKCTKYEAKVFQIQVLSSYADEVIWRQSVQ